MGKWIGIGLAVVAIITIAFIVAAYMFEDFRVATRDIAIVILAVFQMIGAILTIGDDRILFACDYPYEVMEPAARWIERAAISEGDRKKIAAGNARRLFKIA